MSPNLIIAGKITLKREKYEALKRDKARLKFLLECCSVVYSKIGYKRDDLYEEIRINNRRDVDKAMKREGYK